MQQLFFTADLHLGHNAILKHTPRGALFDNIEQHDHWVIDTINMSVGTKDILYILGDVSWHNSWGTGLLLDQIRCQNRFLVFGNHDHDLREFYPTSGLFKGCSDRMFFKHYSAKLALDHFPSAEWNEAHHGSWMLHGHTHGDFPYEARGLAPYRIFDVGLDESVKHDTGYGYHPDAHGYKPFSFEFLNKTIGDKEILTHHGYTRPNGNKG